MQEVCAWRHLMNYWKMVWKLIFQMRIRFVAIQTCLKQSFGAGCEDLVSFRIAFLLDYAFPRQLYLQCSPDFSLGYHSIIKSSFIPKYLLGFVITTNNPLSVFKFCNDSQCLTKMVALPLSIFEISTEVRIFCWKILFLLLISWSILFLFYFFWCWDFKIKSTQNCFWCKWIY